MKTNSHLTLVGLVLGISHGAWAKPVIIQQPQNQTNVAGTTATFAVAATGAEPLSYQWRSYANATLNGEPSSYNPPVNMIERGRPSMNPHGTHT